MSTKRVLLVILAVSAAMLAVGIGTQLIGSAHELPRDQETDSAGVTVPNPDRPDADEGQTTS